jgi:phosphatidylglycerophosphate synthase
VAVCLLIVGRQLGRWRVLSLVALWIALALTIISLVVYFVHNWRVVAGPGTKA